MAKTKPITVKDCIIAMIGYFKDNRFLTREQFLMILDGESDLMPTKKHITDGIDKRIEFEKGHEKFKKSVNRNLMVNKE